MKKRLVYLAFVCLALNSMAANAEFSADPSVVRTALDRIKLSPITGISTGGSVGGARWLDIVGCECTKDGISQDSSDDLCNIQCCRNKYGENGYAVNATCCKKDDDDCICKANGCRTGDLATPLDDFCCAKAQGLI